MTYIICTAIEPTLSVKGHTVVSYVLLIAIHNGPITLLLSRLLQAIAIAKAQSPCLWIGHPLN